MQVKVRIFQLVLCSEFSVMSNIYEPASEIRIDPKSNVALGLNCWLKAPSRQICSLRVRFVF